MLGNLLKDYLRHSMKTRKSPKLCQPRNETVVDCNNEADEEPKKPVHQQRTSWAEVLFAVPSQVQLWPYRCNGILSKNIHWLNHEIILCCKTEPEDLVSSLLKLYRVTLDLEEYSLTSLCGTIEFVHHDGEMFEVIPSSVPDSSPIKQDCCSEVKGDITKKRKSLATTNSASYAGFCGHLLQLETSFLMNIQPEDSLLHHVELGQLCNCLTAKSVQDPFIGSSVQSCDDRYFLRQRNAATSKGSMGQADVSIPDRRHGYMQEFSIEESLIISDTIVSHAPRKYSTEVDHVLVAGILPEYLLQNSNMSTQLSVQGSIPELMSSSTLHNMERLGALADEKAAFVDLNTEGLLELADETAFVLDCALGSQPYLIHLQPAPNYEGLIKWNVQEAEHVKLYDDTVCTENIICKLEKNFMEMFTLKLQGTDLAERSVWTSSISQAVNCLQQRYRDLYAFSQSDQALPWDPVARLSTVAANALHAESEAPFCNIDKSDGMFETSPQRKFDVHNPFFDELENCIIQSPSMTSDAGTTTSIESSYACSNQLQTSKSQQGIKNTGLASLSSGTQIANSLEDFLSLMRRPCKVSARSSNDAVLISKPNLVEYQQTIPEELTATPGHSRCYLTCQKVPGDRSGQTRLAFLTKK